MTWGSPRVIIEDLGASDGRVGSGWVEVDGGYVRRDPRSVLEPVEVGTWPQVLVGLSRGRVDEWAGHGAEVRDLTIPPPSFYSFLSDPTRWRASVSGTAVVPDRPREDCQPTRLGWTKGSLAQLNSAHWPGRRAHWPSSQVAGSRVTWNQTRLSAAPGGCGR